MNNRAKILYRKLMNNELNSETLGLLRAAIESMQNGDFTTTKKCIGDLSITAWEKNKEWLTLLKRISQFKEMPNK